MTDTPDNSGDNSRPSTGDAEIGPSLDPPNVAAGSVRSRLTRTNRILTVALGSGVAALIVGAAFGLGVFVGSEYGGGDDRGDGRGAAEYVDDHHAEPHQQDRQEYDAQHGDEAEGESPDTDPDGPAGQPAGPGVRGGSSVEPSIAPGPPR